MPENVLTINEVKPTPLQGRELYVDVIRVWAMLLVIFQHIFMKYAYWGPTELEPGFWWYVNSVYAIVHASVPLFIMISGLLLLNYYEEKLSVFFKKRFIKVVIPFVFWSVAYLIWKIVFEGYRDISVFGAVIVILNEPIYYHLWFIYVILGLYIITPILRLLLNSANLKFVLFFLGLWLFTTLEPMLYFIKGLGLGIDLPLVSGFVGYFVLGYLIRFIQLKKRWVLWGIFIVMIGSIFLIAGLVRLTYLRIGHHVDIFLSSLSLTMVINTACQFFLLKHLPYDRITKKLPIFPKAIAWLSSLSMGVYLIHPIFVNIVMYNIIGNFSILNIISNQYIALIAAAVLVILGSVIIIWIMRKIPVLKHVVP